ncbi:diguanylate cyclase [Maridesulfovibrio sp.]|uniref:diguanylate cyclase n=1 Tax=Maridesulfovibrio sp. TaxID=2795000 RepID=UPI0039EEE16D
MYYFSDAFEAIFANNNLCRKFIEASPDAIVITDIEGNVLAGNSRAAQLFGYVEKSFFPPNVNDCYKSSEDRKRIIDMLANDGLVQDFQTVVLDRAGKPISISLSVSVMSVGEHDIHISILRDISERKKNEIALRDGEKNARLNETRFEALYSLAGMGEAPLKELYDSALEAAVKITGSEIGYIYFISDDESELSIYAWSHNVMPQCSVEYVPGSYHVSATGLWGDAVRQRRPIIVNDYENCEDKKGLPQGHVSIRRHMNVPLFDNGKIVILIGVGNKEEEYDEEDVRQLSLLADGMLNIVRRKEADAALRHAYSEMEEKVEKRTEELSSALADLRLVNKEMANEVDQRRVAEKKLRLFKRLVELSPDMVALVNSKYTYVMVNDSYVRLFDKPKDFFIGKSIFDVAGKEVFHVHSRTLIDSVLAGSTGRFESWVELPRLGKRFFSVVYHPVESTVDGERLVSITAHDISVQREMLEEVKRLASTDHLTGTNNRRSFMKRAEIEFDRLERYGGELYLMMLDIDHFKNINDTYGHNVGDVVLKEFVSCCISTLRTSDVFSRVGGEEFAALLIHGSVKDAQMVAERLRKSVENMEVRAGQHVVKLTVSIGLAVVSKKSNVETILKRADKCLYQAKAEGRNRVVSYCTESE